MFFHRFHRFGGLFQTQAEKNLVKIMGSWQKNGAPVIGINDSGGLESQEGVNSLGAIRIFFYRNTRASEDSQSRHHGSMCWGGFLPAITDSILYVNTSICS